MSNDTKAPQRTKTSITIYTSGKALVQGAYALSLKQGRNTVALEGMPTHFQQDSLYADQFEGPGEVTMGPINYRAANLNPANQLAKSINSQVTVIHGGTLPAEQAQIEGTLLALNGNTALLRLTDGQIREVRNVQGFIYGGLAVGLANTPALDMTVEASAEGEYEATLLFGTLGISWHAGYKLIYDAAACRVRWDGSIFVRNQSGASYLDAELTCAAGDAGERGGGLEAMHEAMPMAMSAGAPQRSKSVRQARVEALGNVKLYGVPGQISIEDGANPKVTFFVADDVPVKREYRLPVEHNWFLRNYEQDGSFATVLMFVNSEDNKLGKPLPCGAVEVLQRDSRGCLRQTGGGYIQDTAVAEEFELGIGDDFDLKATRRLLKVDRVVPPLPRVEKPAAAETEGEDGKTKKEEKKPRKVVYTRHCEIEITNGKNEDTEVVLAETLPDNCEMVDGNGLAEKTARNFEARITVQALGKAKFQYIVRQTAMEHVDEEAEAARSAEAAEAGDDAEGGNEVLEAGHELGGAPEVLMTAAVRPTSHGGGSLE